MDEKFQKAIEENLVKSGFYSEMKAIKTFLSCGWDCLGGTGYIDREGEDLREVDIMANIQKRTPTSDNKNLKLISELNIIGEVKKSEKPWIIFKTKIDEWERTTVADESLLLFHNFLTRDDDFEHYAFLDRSLKAKLGWKGYGIHEAFKDPQNKSHWYSACMTSLKGAYELWCRKKEKFSQYFENQRLFAWVKPIVIVDGILLTVELDEDMQMSISEVENATINFEIRTPKYNQIGSRIIDIVSLNYLESYIKMSEQDFTELHQYYSRNLDDDFSTL